MMTFDNEMEEWDAEIKDTVKECDSLREQYEGVGLSDVLVHIVHLAFARGAVHQSKVVHNIHKRLGQEAHDQLNNSDSLGL